MRSAVTYWLICCVAERAGRLQARARARRWRRPRRASPRPRRRAARVCARSACIVSGAKVASTWPRLTTSPTLTRTSARRRPFASVPMLASCQAAMLPLARDRERQRRALRLGDDDAQRRACAAAAAFFVVGGAARAGRRRARRVAATASAGDGGEERRTRAIGSWRGGRWRCGGGGARRRQAPTSRRRGRGRGRSRRRRARGCRSISAICAARALRRASSSSNRLAEAAPVARLGGAARDLEVVGGDLRVGAAVGGALQGDQRVLDLAHRAAQRRRVGARRRVVAGARGVDVGAARAGVEHRQADTAPGRCSRSCR